jgi:glycosyltransferase involved in cell wall biosynthesis
MNEKIQLSSIVIARNEELNIRRCIQSQAGVVEDIVVIVDSRTDDKTVEIAKSFPNVHCEVVEWYGYAKTKIYALSKTKHHWILWIDADEEITPELAQELNEFKSGSPAYDAYDLARRAFFLGKWIRHSGWYPSRVTRLFNKKIVGFSEKEVHEHLNIQGEVGHLKHDLNHYTDPSIEHYFKKFNLYTSLAAKEMNEKGKNAGIPDLLLRPVFLFFKMYIFRLGFLDGLYGLILAVFSSTYVFTKYCKLWELNRERAK